MLELLAPSPSASHERVQVVRDAAAGLLCVVAVHSTALGPAMGGVRRMSYTSIDDALADALRLSQAMTLKNSAAGLPLGGGKSVIVHAGERPTTALLESFAEVVDGLGGRYVGAQDIGTTSDDMDMLAARTPWVAGRSPGQGGTGDPARSTAWTVLGAIEQALAHLDGSADLAGRRIGIVGAGSVGGRLVTALLERGAEVLVDDAAPQALADAVIAGARATPTADILATELDVLAPCATGGLITAAVADGLRARIVCGAANNVLADDDLAERLHAGSVLYVPDFVANSGGIIQVGGEFLGWSAEQAEAMLDDAVARVGTVLADAKRRGVTPLGAAHAMAAARLDAVRAGAAR
ncbi:MAG TPA: Glu/Leu/Phe/Val dehydrogenase dimerization domain-containing protein [Baekduia sp.]|uniref:Glu/Leu/Phe/Val dehydrogenase dimerization domain-containing protein n=1 Tax=Baekduia sp. TaxID=2600305 RepID=UPI002D77EE57|nr:Glu/Leu/Phe/Val dehydrogenase dimerization domain-containing protein [Baekduia sp.]HET6505327.1 Glu/Leu/Phe/Val dehydrogenase dimerization domain-containing protein [Baekduia sp.]